MTRKRPWEARLRLSGGVGGEVRLEEASGSRAGLLQSVETGEVEWDGWGRTWSLKTVVLYRPVGEAELQRIEESGFRRFPPRLRGQPIFYPVLTREYAQKIARDWNAKDGGRGFVTRFRVRSDFLDRYEMHEVGGRDHREYWIPAEDLDAFNQNIVGTIEVIDQYQSQG